MFSSLPAQAQRTTWSPLRASKQPFQYHASSHTVQTQPDLVGQQDHHTSRRSSTRALPTSHSARIRCQSTHTSLEVQHSSGGAACDQAQWRCPLQVLCFIQPLQVSESSVSAAHPAAPALSCPAWVMPTVWHGKHVLSANIIHSLIKPLWKGGIFSVTCCELSAQTCWDAAVAAATVYSLQKRQESAVGKEMASAGKIDFIDAYLEVPVLWSFPVPPFSMAGRVSWEPACSICCQGPGSAGEIHLLCSGNPPLLPRLFKHTWIWKKQHTVTKIMKP